MKFARSFIFLTFFMFAVAAYADDEPKLFFYQRKTDWGYHPTNTWFITESRLKKLPGWDEKGEPPLAMSKAITLAKVWLVSLGASTNCFVVDIEFRSLDRGYPNSRYRQYWFYVIRFGEVQVYGSYATCVVLLDGSILEPDRPVGPRKRTISDYLD